VAGMFIDVQVDPQITQNSELAKQLTEVCPVAIFAQKSDGTLRVVAENLDECVLCDLCVNAAPPGSVRVVKLYER